MVTRSQPLCCLRCLSTILVYFCAQHERPGFIGLSAFVVSVEELPRFEPRESPRHRLAGHLRPYLQSPPRHADPQTVRVDLATPGRGLYELKGDVPFRMATASLPLLGPPAALQVLNRGSQSLVSAHADLAHVGGVELPRQREHLLYGPTRGQVVVYALLRAVWSVGKVDHFYCGAPGL